MMNYTTSNESSSQMIDLHHESFDKKIQRTQDRLVTELQHKEHTLASEVAELEAELQKRLAPPIPLTSPTETMTPLAELYSVLVETLRTRDDLQQQAAEQTARTLEAGLRLQHTAQKIGVLQLTVQGSSRFAALQRDRELQTGLAEARERLMALQAQIPALQQTNEDWFSRYSHAATTVTRLRAEISQLHARMRLLLEGEPR